MSKKTEDQTENKESWLNLFKLQYSWHEGEFQSCILATTKEQKQIEKDLKEAASSVKIDEKKEKDVDCLPTAYDKIVNILTRKGYTVCYFIKDPVYSVKGAELIKEDKPRVYEIEQRKEKIEWKKLR